MRSLRRLQVGPFSLEDAVALEDLEKSPVPRPPVDALRGMECLKIGSALDAAVVHGQVLALDVLRGAGAEGPGPWALVSATGDLLAVYQGHTPGQAKPVVVLSDS